MGHGAWCLVFECKETASQALNAMLHATFTAESKNYQENTHCGWKCLKFLN
jgi:hypothetical protein